MSPIVLPTSVSSIQILKRSIQWCWPTARSGVLKRAGCGLDLSAGTEAVQPIRDPDTDGLRREGGHRRPAGGRT